MSRGPSILRLFLVLPALSLLVSCAAAPAAAHSPRGAAPDTVGLRAALERLAEGYPGQVGITVRDLDSGQTVSIRGAETYPSASLIKLPVLITLLDEVHQGRVRLDEPISMIARDRVGGTGILKHMEPGHRLSVGEAAWLMIVLSDNTATNLVLDKVDVRTVWSKMEALGLPHSKVHSKTFRRETSVAMDSSVKYGLGVTTPDEIVELFSLLHRGRAVSPRQDSLALEILAATQDPLLIRRWLPPGVRVAHKTGSVDRARNDCGIIYGPARPIALCVMTRENENTSYAPDNPANLLIARVAREVFRHYHPDAELPPPPW